MSIKQTITITLCECAENHVGMQKLGEKADCGFTLDDLFRARDWFQNQNFVAEIHDLNYPLQDIGVIPEDEAYILIVRKGVDCILGPENNANDLFDEQINLDWDTKALMYGKVLNKNARYNLCFADTSQEPNYIIGKGRIIAFDDVPLLTKIKDAMPEIIGDAGMDLVAEGNYYHDTDFCGIKSHGDCERIRVIGVRIGATMPLQYHWFHNSKPVGEKMLFQLHGGDIYFMSEKAVGSDWKRKTIYTLRHAAGAKKYLKIKS